MVVLPASWLGSALTAGYTLRFWWGAFARKPGLPDPAPAELAHPPTALFLAAPAVLALTGLVLGVASPLLEPLVAAYADTLPLVADSAEKLALWHGWQPALLLSALSLLGGAALFAGRRSVTRWQRRHAVGASADEGYWNAVQGLDRLAVLVTGTTQRGSLPAYLGTILVVVLALPGTLLMTRAPWPDELAALGHPAAGADRRRHPGRGGADAPDPAAAVGGARRRRHRLRAGPHLRPAGCPRPRAHPVPGRDADAGHLRARPAQAARRTSPSGTAPASAWSAASSPSRSGAHGRRRRRGAGARTATPVSAAYPDEAYSFGGGKNIVNVTLVDIRAWDTLGEISLLVVAATGVASLVFLRRRTGAVDRLESAELAELAVAPPAGTAPPRLAASADAAPGAAVGRARGGHPDPLPHHPGVLPVPALLRAQRAGRRVRRRAGRRAGARAALPRRRPLRARRGRAGRPRPAARHRAALRRRHRGRRRCCSAPRCCRRRSSRRRCRCSAT